MGVFQVNKRIDDPDVVVRVHEGPLVQPFVTLTIDEIGFFLPFGMDVERQLEEIARVGGRIIAAAANARLDWVEKQQASLPGVA